MTNRERVGWLCVLVLTIGTLLIILRPIPVNTEKPEPARETEESKPAASQNI